MQLSDLARGRWREILPLLGVSVQYLTNRHGPCPMCGGKDRFRWDDKDRNGTFYCNKCGAGNGWTLARKFNGWDAAETSKAIEEIVGSRPMALLPAEKPQQGLLPSVTRLIEEATDPSVVSAYLSRRGLTATSAVLRGHPRCPYFVEDKTRKGKWRTLGHFPTVLAPVSNEKGEIIGVQRVYDAEVDEHKKILGDLKGGIVRLDEPTDELGVCEGFETGLAARQLFGIPIWAALTAGNLAEFQPPPGIQQLHIFADADVNSVGQAAAYSLAVRVNRWNAQHKTGAEPVKVNLPPDLGTDWLDVLNANPPTNPDQQEAGT